MNHIALVSSAVLGVITGVVGFVVVRGFIVGTVTTDANVSGSTGRTLLSTAEGSIVITAVPIGLALVTFVVAYSVLTRLKG